ncbi:MAG: tetratricopeptide repeat protein [Bacteroidales bacterium]
MIKAKIFLLVLCIVAIPTFLAGQANKGYTEALNEYKEARELFDKEKYAVAQEQFKDVLDAFSESSEYRINAEYYIAICAIELFNEDAEYLISQFISKYPESSKVNQAYFNMGKFQYRQEQYQNVVRWLEKVNTNRLDDRVLSEYRFKLGYSYYKIGSSNNASDELYEIKDKNTKYSSPALYYYSHIAYENGNYQTALEGFKQLMDNKTFAPIMPYYITQIYYFQEKFEEVIDYAPQYVKSATTKRMPEIAKIIGDSYVNLNNYDSALTYLELHKEKSEKLSRQDYYQIGYTAYKLEEYDNAIENFEEVTDEDDELAQSAYYHLADCYLNTNNENKAKLAFEFASKLDHDPEIKENALFNYAKITFQLRNTPFNAAINAFKDYIEKYPDSDNIDEAYNYLVQAYLNSNNYQDALKSLEQVDDMDVSLEKAYQKVAYFRALELYNNRHYDEAILVFNKSLQYEQYDKNIAALTQYWRAESYYQLEKYEDAAASYNSFLMLPGAFSTPVYDKAHYNLGYAYFQQKKYPEAIEWFRKFINLSRSKEPKYLADTYIRLGDCYFLRRSFSLAVANYNQALEVNVWDQDYAMFQSSIAMGLQGQHDQQISSLQTLIDKYPQSNYSDDAHFEIGRSYMDIDNPERAIEYFEKLVDEYSSSQYVKRALVQLGLIHYAQNENEEAIEYLKRVIAEYPGTAEAKNALNGLKNVYVDMDRVDDYVTYVDGLDDDFAEVSSGEQDSLTYTSAERTYMEQGCDKAIQSFQKYLRNFRNGAFTVNAHFYMADCYHRNDEFDKALEHYEYVIDRSRNEYTEQSLAAAAGIYYDNDNYEEALELYERLEKEAEESANIMDARTGQMRILYDFGDYDKAVDAADKVLHTDKISDRLQREALYIKGKSLFELEEYQRARKELQRIAEEVNSKEGAEARYLIAEIYFKQEEWEVAENEILDFIEQNSSQEYWKARSFILLADVYLAMEDSFQAKHTLKSIVENYEPVDDDDDIIELAKEKYNEIIEQEKFEMDSDSIENVEIQFPDEGDTGDSDSSN